MIQPHGLLLASSRQGALTSQEGITTIQCVKNLCWNMWRARMVLYWSCRKNPKEIEIAIVATETQQETATMSCQLSISYTVHGHLASKDSKKNAHEEAIITSALHAFSPAWRDSVSTWKDQLRMPMWTRRNTDISNMFKSYTPAVLLQQPPGSLHVLWKLCSIVATHQKTDLPWSIRTGIFSCCCHFGSLLQKVMVIYVSTVHAKGWHSWWL